MSDLIKPINILCFDCHEEYIDPPGFVHGPVATGKCVVCHNAHFTTNPKRVTRDGDALCTFCHEEIDTITVVEHKNNNKDECLVCHNPHFSEGNNFLVRKDSDLK